MRFMGCDGVTNLQIIFGAHAERIVSLTTARAPVDGRNRSGPIVTSGGGRRKLDKTTTLCTC
jgi:hypothetical protein